MYVSLVNRPNFYYKLYSTHVENLGYTIFRYNDYITSDDIPWLNNTDISAQIEAHLDALRLGGKLPFSCAKDICESGEDDDLVGAAFTLSSLDYDNNLGIETVIGQFEKSEEDSLLFYLMALKYGFNASLSEHLLPLLQHDNHFIRAATVEILGYRGDVDVRRVWPLFYDEETDVRTASMVAVMRLGFKEAVPAIEQAVLQSKEMFNEHCIFPLLMLGSNKALEFVRVALRRTDYIKPQYPIYLALAGKEADFSCFQEAMKFEGMECSVLEALGIFGSLKGVSLLLSSLESDDDAVKLAAADSLNLISGAELYETALMPVDEADEVSIEDVTGKAENPDNAEAQDGENTTEVRVSCTSIDRWTDWWRVNKDRFGQSSRYRYGKPFSLGLCLMELANPESSYHGRQMNFHELVIRSGQHIPFEADWFVDKQIKALKEWQDWWNQNKSSLTDQWMFDGI